MKLIFLLILIFLFSCSHESKRTTVTIATTNKGLVKNSAVSIPMYLSSNPEDKGPEDKMLRIHPGHFLSIENKKDENINIIKSLENANYSLVNLSLEDIAVAETQEINFTDFPKLIFLNSTITDINRDDLYSNKNVVPYFIFEDAVFIGLSDHNINKKLSTSRFLFNDYVYSILKVKKITKDKAFKSYIIVHHLGSEINEIMNRLPPSFINSLAN